MRISDLSSDVCSSDLAGAIEGREIGNDLGLDIGRRGREREAGIRPRHQARLRPDRAHFRHVDEQFQQAEDKILYARALLLVAVVVIESGKIELEMLVEKRQLRQIGRASCRERVCQYV